MWYQLRLNIETFWTQLRYLLRLLIVLFGISNDGNNIDKGVVMDSW